MAGPSEQHTLEVEPDTVEQTLATNPTVATSVPSENQATALPGSYVTRSSRISKPPERVDM